ncbi:MAG TPA: TMEM14 family protein [Polyangiaceae bacterium]
MAGQLVPPRAGAMLQAPMHSLLLACLISYGALVFVGGLIGYSKANSRASLIAGSAFATLLAIAAALVATGSPRWGAGLGAASALALIGRFLPAFIKTKKLMPAGAVVAVGVLVLIVGALVLLGGG